MRFLVPVVLLLSACPPLIVADGGVDVGNPPVDAGTVDAGATDAGSDAGVAGR